MAIYAETPFTSNNGLPTYLTDKKRNGTLGVHIVLVSLAHALGRTVRIVSSLGYSHVIEDPDNHHSLPVCLAHVREKHNVGLEPINV